MKTSINLAKRIAPLAIFAIAILISTNSYSQFSRKYIKMYQNAIYLTWDEEFVDALPIWNKIDSLNPDNSNVHFYIGVCLMNTGEKLKALPYLEEAAKSTEIEYNGDYKEGLAPFQVYYYLGHAYEVSGAFDYAIQNYEKFKDFAFEHDKKQYKKAVKKIADCNSARQYLVTSAGN
jgi:tetratricopeptide (TPR) repeat protein